MACSAPADGTRVWELELDNGGDDDDDDDGGGVGVVRGGGGDGRPRRSRVEEELVVSNAVLLAMVRCLKRRRSPAVPREGIDRDDDGDDDVDIAGLWGRILDRDGDSVTERRVDPRGVVAPAAAAVHGDGVHPRRGGPRSAAWGASRIIDGQAHVVAILPIVAAGPGRTLRMEALPPDDDVPLLPRDVLIVPGSFNPPHAGHVGLANAAVSALRRLRRGERDEGRGDDSFAAVHPCSAPSLSSSASSPVPTSSMSSILRSMWDAVDGHMEGQYDPAVLFEMSVTNADKPPLDPMEVERRVNLFASLSLSLSPSEMPKDWAVILTNAPMFSQKTEILDGLVENDDDLPGDGGPPSRSGNGNTARGRRRRRMSFVIGTDTMVRIIDPKYYGNSREGMVSALLRMKERGVHFIVGGRLEQGSKNW